jgi:uncharacterized membrane protein
MDLRVLFVALFVAFLWGLTPVIHKHVLQTLDPRLVMVIGSGLYFMVALLYGLYYRDAIAESLPNMTPATFLWIALASLLTGFIANLIYLYVLREEQSYIISALIFASPIFTLFVAALFLKEEITVQGFIGVVLITAGIVCLALNVSPARPILMEPAEAFEERG